MALKRTLGVASLSFFGIGMVLGAGIYSVIGAAAVEGGDALWQGFLAGAVVATLTGLSYAELATLYPRAGGEFVYLQQAFPKRRAVALGGGIVIALAASATATTVALAFGGYLRELVPVPPLLAAFGLVAAATAVNIVGIREAAWVNVAFTLLEVSGLVLVIVIGWRQDGFGEALAAPPHVGVLSAAALVFFAYLGFEDIVNLAEECRRPERDVPRAILISIAVTGILYVLVALAVVALASVETLAESDSPLADAVAAHAPRLGKLIVPLALFATANTALATLITASRMTYGMADAGALPRELARVLPTRKSPWLAALVVGAIAAALLPLGDVAFVAGMSSFGALVAFAGVNVAVIVLRWRAPSLAKRAASRPAAAPAGKKRPFRVPLAIGRLPVLPVLGLLSCAALLAGFERAVYWGGAAAAALAAILVILRRKWVRAAD